MDYRRPALAATLLIGCAIPLLAPATAAVAAPVRSLCAPPADTVGPTISKISFTRSTIDLNHGGRYQHVVVTASDTSGKGNPSGVAAVRVGIAGSRFWADVKLKRISGTAASGRWSGRFAVSKYAHAGTYSINYVGVADAAGNEQDYDGYGKTPEGPNSLSLTPAIDPTFTVTGTPATRPPRKPAGTLTAFSFGPATVDTTAAARRVTFTARFSGPAPHRVFVELGTARNSGARFVYLHALLHDHQGVWSGSVLVPRWLGKQVLQPMLEVEYGSHYSPGYRYYDNERLGQLHFANRITVVSGVDKTKPVLKSLSFSPRVIDSTSGAVKVTVTARAADTRSGVRTVTVGGSIRGGQNGAAAGFYPFSAAGIGYMSSNYFTVRLKKTSNGSWVGSTTIRRCVPSGTYKLNAQVQDLAGNYHGYSTQTLAKAKITSTVEVRSKHGDVAAPYVYSAATYGAESKVFLNFSEGVENVNTSTLTVYPQAPASTRFTKTATVSSITCANGKKVVDCSGSGGLVTSAVLVVPSLQPGRQYQVYANLRQVTVQLTDGNRNPMTWNFAATEVKDS